ncbi:MAG: hypothetical protein OHK0012_10780 [Synechococcales cyanobacterium]
MKTVKFLKRALGTALASVASLSSVALFSQSSSAMYLGDPDAVTLEDVVSCLVIFQNPGTDLTADQLAAGVNAILGGTIAGADYNPVPTPAICDFVNTGSTATSLEDVIAPLVVFQNPGTQLTEQQLADGINAILGSAVTATQINAIPPNLPNQEGASSLTVILRSNNPENPNLARPGDTVTIEVGIINPQGNPNSYNVAIRAFPTISASFQNPDGTSTTININAENAVLDFNQDNPQCGPAATECTVRQQFVVPQVPAGLPAGTTITGQIAVTVDATEILVAPINGPTTFSNVENPFVIQGAN